MGGPHRRDAPEEADNPFAAPARKDIAPGPPGIRLDPDRPAAASLIERGWLVRSFLVVTREGAFHVKYDGSSAGDYVYVQGERAAGRGLVFLPIRRFDFRIGDLPARVLVRHWFALAVRGFALRIGGEDVYAEGCYAGRPPEE